MVGLVFRQVSHIKGAKCDIPSLSPGKGKKQFKNIGIYGLRVSCMRSPGGASPARP